jgi:hypothetical protein
MGIPSSARESFARSLSENFREIKNRRTPVWTVR